MINKDDILDAQKKWSEGVIKMGTTKSQPQEAKKYAENFVDQMYAFDESSGCLFKPTKAQTTPFRDSREGAVSYFVGGNSSFSEDKGFALNPWKHIEFQNEKLFCYEDHAIASGHYFFTDDHNEKTKVEYTFSYTKDNNDQLKINLHHSSLPYSCSEA